MVGPTTDLIISKWGINSRAFFYLVDIQIREADNTRVIFCTSNSINTRLRNISRADHLCTLVSYSTHNIGIFLISQMTSFNHRIAIPKKISCCVKKLRQSLGVIHYQHGKARRNRKTTFRQLNSVNK